MNDKLKIGFVFGILILAIAAIGFVKIGKFNQPKTKKEINKNDQSQNFEPTKAVDENIIISLLTPEQISAKPSITIVKAFDDYIKADVFLNPGGFYLLAAKVDGVWQKALAGNGIPKCSEIMEYNFPREIIPNCLQGEDLLLTLSWGEAKSAIANCEVATVMQTHAREVTLDLKDGRSMHTLEPVIDDVIDSAIAAREVCGDIMIGTE